MHPLISIILPTYNGSRYLSESINGIIDQSYTNWELIIVDDGSTDSTPDIIKLFKEKDKRIRSITHSENLNLPNALNTGFAASKGEYLTWTSDDNLYKKEALFEMVRYLENNINVDIVFCDFSIIDENGNLVKNITLNESNAFAYTNYNGGCFLYRRIVFEKIGFYNINLFGTEDWDYWLRALKFFTISQLHKNLYAYRFHPKSLSNEKKEMIFKSLISTLFENLPQIDIFTEKDISKGYYTIAHYALYLNNLPLTIKALLLAYWHSPSELIKCILMRDNILEFSFYKRVYYKILYLIKYKRILP